MLKSTITALTLALLAATSAQAELKINPGPQPGAPLVKENARGTVWCEVIPMVGTPPNAVMHVYTSTFADNCTEQRSAALDMTKLAAELGVPKVVMNPGRYWTFDRMTAFTAGELVDFNGIKAHWGATMTPQDVAAITGAKPYSVGKIKRDTEWFYMKGKPAYLLRTPEGKVWVLQVFTKAKDPTLSIETLDQLGAKLQLPEGWKFEIKVLDKDLSLQPRNVPGTEAYIMRDNLGNTYMGCGFDAACSYIP
jgi:hypothetical protein